MEFKEKILQVRVKLNLSQEALAKLLDVSFITINRWENGKVKPNKLAELRFNEFCKSNGISFDE